MNPQLKFNCPERWEDMKVGMLSRHCDLCSKDVVDFTAMTRQQIVEYLLERRGQDVCGRIHAHQLDYHHTERQVIITEILQKHRSNTNILLYMLAVGSLTLVACGSSDKDEVKTHIEATTNDTSCENRDETASSIDDPGYLGMVSINPDTTNAPDEPTILPEIMPEFIGGEDSLMAFIQHNIKYPEKEKKAGEQGLLHVQFIIDKKGNVKEPKILTSNSKSENFKNEVLRVIKLMPQWKPGKHNGHTVETYYFLPVKFTLK